MTPDANLEQTEVFDELNFGKYVHFFFEVKHIILALHDHDRRHGLYKLDRRFSVTILNVPSTRKSPVDCKMSSCSVLANINILSSPAKTRTKNGMNYSIRNYKNIPGPVSQRKNISS